VLFILVGTAVFVVTVAGVSELFATDTPIQ